jgi:alginate O-acetyltransferase complex protein AlgI
MLSSTLQIYFDFSGYSDMAIGLGLLFGIRLPFNFNSPLKARNMVELWTRWHMSLTRFLTAYIYNPIVLARSRRWASLGRPLPKKGKTTNAAFWALIAFPTIITMLIAGIWHGAGYQFVIFGFLNGLFMAICHKWRLFKQAHAWHDHERLLHAPAVFATVLCYTFTLVFFKAPDIRSAIRMTGNLLGLRGFWGPTEIAPSQVLILIALFAAVWLLPNSQEIMGIASTSGPGPSSSSSPSSKWRQALSWRPTMAWAFGMGVVGFISLFAMALGRESPFLYFQF